MMGADDLELCWLDRVLLVMDSGKWFSRKQVHDALGLDYKTDKYKSNAVNSYLLRLVKTGFIVRAHAPDILNGNPFRRCQYVYRTINVDKKIKVIGNCHKVNILNGRIARQKSFDKRKRTTQQKNSA